MLCCLVAKEGEKVMNKIINFKTIIQVILIISFLIFLYHLINTNSKFSIVWLVGIFTGMLFLLNSNNDNDPGYPFIQFFKVFGVIATFFLGWQELELIRINQNQNIQVNLLNMKMTESKLENETFAAMLKTLTSPQLEVRVGGIYALENLARTNKDFYWPVLHTLISYVKTHRSIEPNDKKFPYNKNIQTDIQAILNFVVEGQYDMPHTHTDSLDLSHIHLLNVDLSGGKLAYVNFEGSILKNVDFNGADLTGANFRNATLRNIHFTNSKLIQANFNSAKLAEVNFLGANLESSQFGNALFSDRKKNYSSLFSDAKLASVNFCVGFDTEKRDLIFECASGLMCTDFKFSKLFNTTKLPEDLNSCNFVINQDPTELKIREAIKSGNLASIPSSIGGRVIYKRIPSI